MNSKNFVKIDLHVHTPSSKCYKGNKNEEEYFKIVEKSYNQGLKIIAITDHNCIDGYKKIIKYKEKLVTEKNALKKIKDSKQSKDKLKKITKKLSIFNNVLVLPGIEFEVYNCIHLLVIFNVNTPLGDIEKFLYEGGYGPGNQGLENPAGLSSLDIKMLLEETKKYDCIVLDAHTDSSKGIYTTIEEGKLRAAIFSSDQLYGLCYNSETTKDKIANIVNGSREYKRSRPLAYLKASDAHCLNEIAKTTSWFNLTNLNFQSLKESFSNPVENISTEKPEINEILQKILSDGGAFGVQDFSEENQAYFRQLVCAMHNTEGGYCLFGVTKNKNKIGLSVSGNKKEIKKAVEDYLMLIVSNLKKINSIRFRSEEFNIYDLQENKIIISLRINSGSNLVDVIDDGKIYLLKGRELKVASADEIQNLIENRNSIVIENKINKKIEIIEKECFFINNFFVSLPIVKKIEKKSRKLRKVIKNIEVVQYEKNKKEIEIISLAEEFPNGQSDGNVMFYLHKSVPRLDYGYLRISPPSIKLNYSKKNKNEESIYLFLGGAVHLVDKKQRVYLSREMLGLKFRSGNKEYSNRFIVSFLKSSVWLWYCINKFESADFFSNRIFQESLIPIINFTNPKTKEEINKIEKIMDVIMVEENKILLNIEKEQKVKVGVTIEKKIALEKKLSKLVIEHNKNVGNNFHEIDKIIYSILELSEKEIDVIETYLRTKNLYIPPALKN